MQYITLKYNSCIFNTFFKYVYTMSSWCLRYNKNFRFQKFLSCRHCLMVCYFRSNSGFQNLGRAVQVIFLNKTVSEFSYKLCFSFMVIFYIYHRPNLRYFIVTVDSREWRTWAIACGYVGCLAWCTLIIGRDRSLKPCWYQDFRVFTAVRIFFNEVWKGIWTYYKHRTLNMKKRQNFYERTQKYIAKLSHLKNGLTALSNF